MKTKLPRKQPRAVAPKTKNCAHPPARLYTWTAYDGTRCVCCCACGAVLQGGAK